jgi:geranylgeranyl pyrophosphate synthase
MTPALRTPAPLGAFLAAVYARAHEALDRDDFHPTQRRSLAGALGKPWRAARRQPLGDPLCVIHLIVRAHERAVDEQVEHLAAFCLFYLLSLDLFDDVQDDDLDDEISPALAINDAIAFGFLAQDQLRQAVAVESDPERRHDYLELACRVSLCAVGGQHRDLLGANGAGSPAEVLQMHEAKTSSVQLLTECGALLAGRDGQDQALYREIGRHFAAFIQIRDDLRDIFGKAQSPDLATGKMTYPMACFLERSTGSERDTFDALADELPTSLPAIRDLVYASGAVAASARALDAERTAIHRLVAAVGAAAPLRTFLDVVDGLAEAVYVPPTVAETAHWWQRPSGAWHDDVRRQRDAFVARMRPLGLPDPPRLRPWHHPHWMYVPAKKTIYYPDLEGMAEEILPFQTALLGASDGGRAREVMQMQLPLVLAHELFHFWRDATGRLTDDHWHEEWAANRLSVAYANQYCSDELSTTHLLCAEVIGRHVERLDEQALAVLQRCPSYQPGRAGYGMDMLGTAIVHLEMVRRLIDEQPVFEEAQRALLSPVQSAAALPRSA